MKEALYIFALGLACVYYKSPICAKCILQTVKYYVLWEYKKYFSLDQGCDAPEPTSAALPCFQPHTVANQCCCAVCMCPVPTLISVALVHDQYSCTVQDYCEHNAGRGQGSAPHTACYAAGTFTPPTPAPAVPTLIQAHHARSCCSSCACSSFAASSDWPDPQARSWSATDAACTRSCASSRSAACIKESSQTRSSCHNSTADRATV